LGASTAGTLNVVVAGWTFSLTRQLTEIAAGPLAPSSSCVRRRKRKNSSCEAWADSSPGGQPLAYDITRGLCRRQSRAAETFSLSLTEEIATTSAHECISPSSETAYLEAVRRRAILEAIADLPPCYRQVVCLADLEGLSYQEVAYQTGVPIGTVRSRLFRARKRLEKPLAAWRRP